MAEGFFNALAGGKARAKSGGNMPADKVNPLAAQVMAKGLDTSNLRPKPITRHMVEEADKVILMGCGRDVCPIVPKEVVDWQIENPFGKGMKKFREVRNLIEKKVKELLIEIRVSDL